VPISKQREREEIGRREGGDYVYVILKSGTTPVTEPVTAPRPFPLTLTLALGLGNQAIHNF